MSPDSAVNPTSKDSKYLSDASNTLSKNSALNLLNGGSTNLAHLKKLNASGSNNHYQSTTTNGSSSPRACPSSPSSNNFHHKSISSSIHSTNSVNNNNINDPTQNMQNDDPKFFIHQKFDKIIDVTRDLTALSIAAEDGYSISHQRLVKTASGVRELAKRLGKASININVNSIMIVTKARDNSLVYLTRDLAYWLIHDTKKIVYVDSKLKKSKRFGAPSLLEKLALSSSASSSSTLSNYETATNNNNLKSNLRYWTKTMPMETPEMFDLVITLGGDGTVLYVAKLFQRIVPPIISFSLGSLGFLTNFRFEDARKTLTKVFNNGINVNLRMRFSCTVHAPDGSALSSHEVLNEIVIDRGPSPWVSMLELYGNDSLLTVVQADGLILSTPTGSTAYSLSAGGSLVHPEISAVSVTPICPHTLSFRPMLLPDSMVFRVTVPKRSRSTAWAAFDGHDRTELKPGYYVTVSASQFPFPTIVSSPTEYIDSVSRTLKWNVRQQQKPFEHLLTNESRRRYQNLDLNSAFSDHDRKDELSREDDIEDEEAERKESTRHRSPVHHRHHHHHHHSHSHNHHGSGHTSSHQHSHHRHAKANGVEYRRHRKSNASEIYSEGDSSYCTDSEYSNDEDYEDHIDENINSDASRHHSKPSLQLKSHDECDEEVFDSEEEESEPDYDIDYDEEDALSVTISHHSQQ